MFRPPYRTGFGFDVHAFAEGRDLWLCGVKVPHTLGLEGHSDADVAIHALCDALLGSLSLRDIGWHFSDKDPRYKGIDSTILLREVCRMVRKKGYEIANADITVCAQAPKLSPYIDGMILRLADVMGIDCKAVSVKATTTEHLGFTGREEGIAAFASVLVYIP